MAMRVHCISRLTKWHRAFEPVDWGPCASDSAQFNWGFLSNGSGQVMMLCPLHCQARVHCNHREQPSPTSPLTCWQPPLKSVQRGPCASLSAYTMNLCQSDRAVMNILQVALFSCLAVHSTMLCKKSTGSSCCSPTPTTNVDGCRQHQ